MKQDEVIIVKIVQSSKGKDDAVDMNRTTSLEIKDGIMAVIEFWQIDDKTLAKWSLQNKIEIEDPIMREM
jgi:hypothetical protein